MTVTTDLRFFDKERALKNTFPGIDCGNKKCLMICAETLSAAQTMRLNEKQAVEKAIQQHILPEFHCTPAMNHQLLHQNVCRFGFYPEDRTILPLSSKPPKLKLKQFVADASACKKCKELDGKIVTHLEERDSAKMRQKGFYKQNDDFYAPHPHCKCGWKNFKGITLVFASANLKWMSNIVINATVFDGLNDLIDKINAKKLQDNSVVHLIIIAHGRNSGNTFPISKKNSSDRFEDILAKSNSVYLDTLTRIMAPMGLIELRMCKGAKDKWGERIAQNIANKTGCFIRAYNTEINLLGWGVKRVPKNKNDISIQIPTDLSGHFKDFHPSKK